jgi:hypothetical protein
VGAAAFSPLVVLLDEAATGDRARGDFLDLQQQPEKICTTAPEALLVVNPRHAPAPRPLFQSERFDAHVVLLSVPRVHPVRERLDQR